MTLDEILKEIEGRATEREERGNCAFHFCPLPCDTCDLRTLRQDIPRLIAALNYYKNGLRNVLSKHMDVPLCQNIEDQAIRILTGKGAGE